MGGDHAVLGAFSTIADTFLGGPVLLPVPFLFLGLLVSVVQTMVFALLSSVYIAMAVEEGH
jgi:F-type H+-transporting ATPase subunit a